MKNPFTRSAPPTDQPIRLSAPIGTLPPKRQSARQESSKRSRKTNPRKRFYTAGESASFLGWDTPLVSADTAIYRNMVNVKARCRDIARNNDYARHFLRLLRSNVVGPKGFRFQSKLRASQGRDREYNRELEGFYNASGKLKNSPSVCGRMTRRDMQDLWITTLAVEGEVITLQHPGFEKNKFRYATQFVDPALLDWQMNEDRADGTKIKMGVEVDSLDRPIRYHFLNAHPSDHLWQWGQAKGKHVIVNADRVKHTYIMESPGQTRGVSWLASPAVRAHMLNRFEEAAVVGARVAASKMGFYKKSDDYAGDLGGSEQDDDGEYGENISFRTTSEPGAMEELPVGVEIETFDPDYPPTGFEEFEKKMLKGICSGLGGSYVHIANDLEGVNYSSIRSGDLEQRAMYRALQQFCIDHEVEPSFNEWAAVQTMNPNVTINSKKLSNVIDLDAYTFMGRGWAWVDPLKEVKAYREAVAAKFTSHRRVVSESLGEDFEELLDEIEEDQAMMEERGITPGDIAPVIEAGNELLEEEEAEEEAKEGAA